MEHGQYLLSDYDVNVNCVKVIITEFPQPRRLLWVDFVVVGAHSWPTKYLWEPTHQMAPGPASRSTPCQSLYRFSLATESQLRPVTSFPWASCATTCTSH